MESRLTDKSIGISLLGMGNMRLPCHEPAKGEKYGKIDYEKAQEIIDYAYANGVTYFDTAYMYHEGESEVFIGKALAKYPRDTFFIADKMPIWMCKEKADVERIFLDQLQKTGFEFFDYYLLHSLDGRAFEKCEEYGVYEYLLKMQSEGRIRKIGVSFHGTVEELKVIVAARSWDFAQIQLNYLDFEDQSAKQQYEVLRGAGIPVIIMEPVRGGKLASPGAAAEQLFRAYDSEKSPAAWALRFAASLPGVMTVLSGMTSLEQIKDNINTFNNFEPMNAEEYDIVKKAAACIRKTKVVPCTACDYCADCPQGVQVSKIFRIYNSYLTGEYTKEQAIAEYKKIKTGISSCVRCGKCKEHCPQGIDIPGVLHGGAEDLFGK
ncbi:MAG: aldo/keto reductase [Clostridia bacterium]|nr:aldo/keto reductase [Clostridia bacterium]